MGKFFRAGDVVVDVGGGDGEILSYLKSLVNIRGICVDFNDLVLNEARQKNLETIKIDLSKLENVKHHGSKVIARCPACAETGNDRKGEHLFIEQSDRFGCVVFPGADGHKHRQRIFELVGIKTNVPSGFKIRKATSPTPSDQPIKKDILGRLGHVQSTHARKVIDETPLIKEIPSEPLTAVPSVPEDSRHLYSPNELEMLNGIDAESLQRIDEVKRLFNGTVVSVVDRKT